MEAILDRALRVAQAAEVYRVHHRDTPVSFEANRLKSINTRESTTYSLRLVVDGRLGLATATSPEDAAALVEMALQTAQFGDVAAFTFPQVNPPAGPETYDPAVEAVPWEDMVALGQGLVDTLRRHTPELVCEARVSKSIVEAELINSSGLHLHRRKSLFSVAVEATLIRGTDMLFVGDSTAWCRPLRDAGVVAHTALEQLELARETAPAPQGEVPVIFTPLGVASALMLPLTLGFNGRNVLQGTSPLIGQRGKPVFDRRLSLWDDPTIPYAPGSRPWDDEGTPSQRTPLIQEGVVAHFLYDLQTAAKAGARSTGNAGRAGGAPSPAPTTWVIPPGDTPYPEMIASIQDGLIVEELIGAGMGNTLGGDFSGNVLLGYRVQGGRVVGRVKDTMVWGNVYQALKQLIAIGKETRWVGGRLLTPALCCRLSVSTRAA